MASSVKQIKVFDLLFSWNDSTYERYPRVAHNIYFQLSAQFALLDAADQNITNLKEARRYTLRLATPLPAVGRDNKLLTTIVHGSSGSLPRQIKAGLTASAESGVMLSTLSRTVKLIEPITKKNSTRHITYHWTLNSGTARCSLKLYFDYTKIHLENIVFSSTPGKSTCHRAYLAEGVNKRWDLPNPTISEALATFRPRIKEFIPILRTDLEMLRKLDPAVQVLFGDLKAQLEGIH